MADYIWAEFDDRLYIRKNDGVATPPTEDTTGKILVQYIPSFVAFVPDIETEELQISDRLFRAVVSFAKASLYEDTDSNLYRHHMKQFRKLLGKENVMKGDTGRALSYNNLLMLKKGR